MKFMVLVLGFSLIAHVKCRQLDVHIEDILYGEDEEEDDEEAVLAGRTSSTTAATTTTTTTTQATTTIPTTVASPLVASANLTNTTTASQNITFVLKPANGTIFGSLITAVGGGPGVSTERATYVLGQVGNIWNNVGKLNVSGIVDHALGIRNSYIARPLVNGILNIVFCNPLAFSENNCRKRGKDATDTNSTNIS